MTKEIERWTDCPNCETPVKSENLIPHLEKAHFMSETQAKSLAKKAKENEYEKKVIPTNKKHRSSTLKEKAIPLILIILIGVIVVLAAFGSMNDTYPEIEVSPTTYDFGDIPQEVVNHTFIVKNTGDAVLKINAITTDCGCTTAVIEVDGRVSQTFDMDDPWNWEERIHPGKSARLTVTYDATLHPDEEGQERTVFIQSNDPDNPEVSISLFAYILV